MPTLSIRVQSEGKDQHGNVALANPSTALREVGPIVYVTLYPFEDQIKSLAKKGDIPTPVAGTALIDTGASVTCIDQSAARKAGLAIVDSGGISSVTHTNEVVPIFAGRLNIHGLSPVNTFRAYGVNLESQNLIALIGRDLLASCVLVYNGTDDSFSLSL